MIHMPLSQAIFMGILQGLGEFAPISSSAHLVLFPWLVHPFTQRYGWIDDPGQAFDAALHIGTAIALILYFYRTWCEIIAAWWRSLPEAAGFLKSGKPLQDANARVGWLIIIATIPGALFGKLFEKKLDTLFDVDHHPWAPCAIGVLLAVAGVALWAADRYCPKERGMSQIGRKDALIIGLSQVLALFPGVSRSGSTITAGLALGMRRPAAARFSFLMATPITLGAGLLKVFEMRHSTDAHPQASALVAGIVTSAIVGYLVIKWLLNYLQSQNMNLFVVYRIIFGVFVIAVWLARR